VYTVEAALYGALVASPLSAIPAAVCPAAAADLRRTLAHELATAVPARRDWRAPPPPP
jgi:hypothetical protein